MKEPKNFVADENHKTKEDVINQQFNLIKIEKIAGYVPEGRTKRTIYQCLCKCGNTFLARSKDITNNKIKSCGCFHKETSSKTGKANKKETKYVLINSAYHSYFSRAKKKNLIFSLTKEEFTNITTKNCEYCGIEPKQNFYYYKTKENNNDKILFNGLDRIDSNEGYLLDNVVPCCKTCNFAKNSLRLQEFEIWIDRIIKYRLNKGLLTSQTVQKEKEENKNTNANSNR